MSVYNYCPKCFTSFDLKKTICPKCQTPVPRENKKFRVEVMVNRKRVSQVVPKSLKNAKDIETALKSGILTSEFFKQSKVNYTLDDVFSQYFNSSVADGMKSIEKIKCFYSKHIRAVMGKHQIKNIKPGQVERFKNDLLQADRGGGVKYAPKTVKNIIDIISVLFNYAHRYLEYNGENPCDRVERMKINNMVINVLPLEMYKSFLFFLETYPNVNMANLFKFMAYTGVRIGEALKLTWTDVNDDYGVIVLRDPKSGKDEHLPLNDSARAVLKAHRGINKGPTVFDYTYKKVHGEFRRIKRAAELPDNFRIHDIRHQFATMLLNAGESITEVQKVMTHKDSKTTERYAHFLQQSLQKTVNKIDDILKK